MSEHLKQAQYIESVRDFVSSPIPGEIKLPDGEGRAAMEALYGMNPNRYDDLDHASAVIESVGEDDNLPPVAFRADTVAVISSMLGSKLGSIDMTDEEIIEADRIIFRGGKTKWLGLDIETRPLFEDFMVDINPVEAESSEIGKYIFETNDGVSGPSLLGRDQAEHLQGDETVQSRDSSLAGKLLKRLLKHGPSEQVREADLSLLMEHYEATGQILLGTNDQFVDNGDPAQGSKAFWLLQLHESEQKPVSQTTNPAGNIVVKYYEDGSRRTEMYDGNRHTAKLIFEASSNVVAFGDQRAEDPIMTVVAGYEQMKKVPYLPAWMKESEAADHPTTALLDVYPDRYVIRIQN